LPKSRGYIVNYHATYERDRANFDSHVAFLSKHFEVLPLDRLSAWVASRRDRPALSFTFDDGAASNYQVAAPVLESHGHVGAFFVPTDFVSDQAAPPLDPPRAQQRTSNFRMNYLDVDAELEAGLGRVSMTWDELRDLHQRGHAIGAHGHKHHRLGASLEPDVMRSEIFDSRARLKSELGSAPDWFCWIGGEEASYSAEAADMIRQAGYSNGLMTCCKPITSSTDNHQWHRFNLEADEPLSKVRLVLGGAYEIVYTPKRRRVNELTSSGYRVAT